MDDETQRVLVVADTHCGSTVALWPEGQPIQDGGEYRPNAAQVWLWQCWQTALSEIAALPSKPVGVFLGDVIQGGLGKDTQLVSGLPSVQGGAAVTLLRPLVGLCSRVFFVRGTEWHEGPISDAMEAVARELGGEQNPTTRGYTWPTLYLDVGGSVIHLAHHVGVSSVPAYEATMPTREMLTLLQEMARNWPTEAPNLQMIVRAHRHRGVHVELPPSLHALVVPGWQLSTAFANKKMPGLLPQVGYGVVEGRGGRLAASLRTFELPRPAIQRVEVCR